MGTTGKDLQFITTGWPAKQCESWSVSALLAKTYGGYSWFAILNDVHDVCSKPLVCFLSCNYTALITGRLSSSVMSRQNSWFSFIT